MKKQAKGKKLESMITRVNMSYRREKKALILYNGTPVTITNNGGMVEKAKPDFEGVIQGGKYVCFDAKETKSTTSLSLSNLREHQVIYLSLVKDFGGCGFFLVQFYNLHEDKVYKIPIECVSKYWEEWKAGTGRASIPVSALEPDWLVSINNYLEL